jgi:hypothetical protein
MAFVKLYTGHEVVFLEYTCVMRNWLTQLAAGDAAKPMAMPWDVPPEERERPHREGIEATDDRMTQEQADYIQRLFPTIEGHIDAGNIGIVARLSPSPDSGSCQPGKATVLKITPDRNEFRSATHFMGKGSLRGISQICRVEEIPPSEPDGQYFWAIQMEEAIPMDDLEEAIVDKLHGIWLEEGADYKNMPNFREVAPYFSHGGSAYDIDEWVLKYEYIYDAYRDLAWAIEFLLKTPQGVSLNVGDMHGGNVGWLREPDGRTDKQDMLIIDYGGTFAGVSLQHHREDQPIPSVYQGVTQDPEDTDQENAVA